MEPRGSRLLRPERAGASGFHLPEARESESLGVSPSERIPQVPSGVDWVSPKSLGVWRSIVIQAGRGNFPSPGYPETLYPETEPRGYALSSEALSLGVQALSSEAFEPRGSLRVLRPRGWCS